MATATGLSSTVPFVTDLTAAGEYFAEVAATDPLSALLLVIGNLLIVFSVGVLGYLALGAFVDAVTPESLGRAPPQQD